jgi:phosphoglycolate phosphatase
MMLIKAIIFDLDGTLLDTLEDIADSANSVLANYGFPTHNLDSYRYFVGNGLVKLMISALPNEKRDRAINDGTIEACVEAFGEAYARRWNAKTRPYKGVPEMLDALTARRLKLAVLSNKPDHFTKKCVSELLSPWTFDIVLGQRNGIPRKPDPAGAQEIVEYLKIAPAHMLYLGDTAIDMQTAVAAGILPVGVLWGFRPRHELEDSGAQVLLERPQEILNLVRVEN